MIQMTTCSGMTSPVLYDTWLILIENFYTTTKQDLPLTAHNDSDCTSILLQIFPEWRGGTVVPGNQTVGSGSWRCPLCSLQLLNYYHSATIEYYWLSPSVTCVLLTVNWYRIVSCPLVVSGLWDNWICYPYHTSLPSTTCQWYILLYWKYTTYLWYSSPGAISR